MPSLLFPSKITAVAGTFGRPEEMFVQVCPPLKLSMAFLLLLKPEIAIAIWSSSSGSMAIPNTLLPGDNEPLGVMVDQVEPPLVDL